MGGLAGAFSASYPSDIRAGAGLKASTSGLALRIALDYTNVPLLKEVPSGGHVLVQQSDGTFGRLDFQNLPTTTVADGTVTNAKFTPAPPLTIKGNAANVSARPQDIDLTVLAAEGNPIGDAIAAAAAKAGSPTIVNGKPGPNITLSAADVAAVPAIGPAISGANISAKVPSGAFWTAAATKAKGWPEDSNSYAHLITTSYGPSDTGEYYALQFAGGFFDNDNIYVRKVLNNGLTTWRKLWHDGNFDGASPRRGQFFQALKASGAGRISAVMAAVPLDPDDALNIAFNHTTFVTQTGALAQFVKTTLGLTDAQLAAIVANARTLSE